jgi:CheY-like chemotaxis protein
MPGDSGDNVLRRVRENAALPFIPAVAVTALNRLDRERFVQAGFQDCVGKPVDARVLIATITAVLDAAEPPVASAA